MFEGKLPSPSEALKKFFKYPLPPGPNTTLEEIAVYQARVQEIGQRISVLNDPNANQTAVRQIRAALLGKRLGTKA